MKIKGTLLKFNKIIAGYHIFPKGCKIHIPDKVPLIYDFNFDQVPYGMATVTRTDTGLEMVADICEGAAEIVKAAAPLCGIGGFYTEVKFKEQNYYLIGGDAEAKIKDVQEATLSAICITPSPVSPDYKYEVIYEENLKAEDK